MTLLALESGWAILGGLIPIVGFGLLAWILWKAAKPPEGD